MALYRIGRDHGIWDIDALGRAMSATQLKGQLEFYLAEDQVREELRVEAETGARLKKRGR